MLLPIVWYTASYRETIIVFNSVGEILGYADISRFFFEVFRYKHIRWHLHRRNHDSVISCLKLHFSIESALYETTYPGFLPVTGEPRKISEFWRPSPLG